MTQFQKLTLILLVFILLFSIAAAAPNIENITATINNTLKITLDGKTFTAKDANGKLLKPIVYKGSTYLPVRAVAEAAGLKVNYNAAASTVELISAQESSNNTALFNIPTANIEFGRFPTNDWNANSNLTRVSNLTFINTNSTGTADKDKEIAGILIEDIKAIAEGQVSPNGSFRDRFVLDSPDIDRIYEFSKVCAASKLLGLDIFVTTKDIEIMSLGFDPSNYKLVKQDAALKNDAWQAVVLKGTIVINASGKTQTISGYHLLIKDSTAKNALKYYAEVSF